MTARWKVLNSCYHRQQCPSLGHWKLQNWFRFTSLCNSLCITKCGRTTWPPEFVLASSSQTSLTRTSLLSQAFFSVFIPTNLRRLSLIVDILRGIRGTCGKIYFILTQWVIPDDGQLQIQHGSVLMLRQIISSFNHAARMAKILAFHSPYSVLDYFVSS